ncbi:hypothetical protein ACWDG1_42355 [Streptomyces sp. NPDC001177]
MTALRDQPALAPRSVYDLTVDGPHTFYVRLQGGHSRDVLVHNSSVRTGDAAHSPRRTRGTLAIRSTEYAAGLTRLFQNATGTIGARRTPGGGCCFHCDGTGLARPLWEPA